MNRPRVMVVGGGAAGFFAAITCAEANPSAEVVILEKSNTVLGKVLISGGGRCNVTHACFDPRAFCERYPRGGKALIGAFQQFQARDTVAWFEQRGVRLKTEPDGRMFPVSNHSQTIIDCLVGAARDAGVVVRTRCGVEEVHDAYRLTLSGGETIDCDRLLLATGGCRSVAGARLAVALGHQIEAPVPSLFTFHSPTPWLASLAGITVESVTASVPGTKLREHGPLLITHGGLSGPVILRLSAWGARELQAGDYRFPLRVDWLPQQSAEMVARALETLRAEQPAKLLVNTPLAPLPARLWEQLVLAAGIDRETRWSRLARGDRHRLVQQLTRTEMTIDGKSLNKDEFVTCGGVQLGEVNFRTMESRLRPGLYFAGELLDIDGLTGGFNFQAAWTTGWIAGRALAASLAERATGPCSS